MSLSPSSVLQVSGHADKLWGIHTAAHRSSAMSIEGSGLRLPGLLLLGSLEGYNSGGVELNKAAPEMVKQSRGETRSSPDGRGLGPPPTRRLP